VLFDFVFVEECRAACDEQRNRLNTRVFKGVSMPAWDVHRVAGFDLAPSAIRLSVEKTKAAGLEATFQLVDFLRDEPPSPFDWLFEHTLFCAINPPDRDAYVQAVLRWLKPDGQYLAVNYFIPDKDGPPFGTTREEQWKRFSPYFDLVEEWTPRSYPNRTGLERMFWWRKKG